MSTTRETAAPTARKKRARGNEHVAVLGHETQNTSSTEGAIAGGALPNGWKWKTIPDLVGDNGVFIDGDWVESKDQDPTGTCG